MASDRAVLNGNDVFSILVVSTKKQYSSFLKKVFVIQKISFKVKVSKTFETFTDCHIKTCRCLNGGLFWKSLAPLFRRPYGLSVGFKVKTLKKAFSNVKTKTNSNFAAKVTERSNHSFLLSIWWFTFFRHLYDNGTKRT